MPVDVAALVQRIKSHQACVAVIGLGYVGLPFACAAAHRGYSVIGCDIDTRKIELLSQGLSYISHISESLIAPVIASGRLTATADMSRIKDADIVIICVPTPLTAHREPDLTYILRTAEGIAPYVRAGQLIVLESTTYPGTTREEMLPILERGGLKSGRDLFIAYSSEREDPGNLDYDTVRIPRVIGSDGDAALQLATSFYREIVAAIVPVSSLETAEAVKLTENIFRSVNIALVNELKIVYDAMGIDVWEVIEAAKSKPFGFMPFYPGPGLGGHCIPIDPFYLTWKAREYGISTRFIELAGEINTAMPHYVIDRLATALSDRFSKGLNRARVLLIGIAYKKNVDDTRESPAFRIVNLLEKRGAIVEFHDPMVAEIPMTREHGHLAGRRSVALSSAEIARHDAVLICTDHDAVDYRALAEHAKLIVDTRNACARAGARSNNIVKA